jgi:hypothetical protein
MLNEPKRLQVIKRIVSVLQSITAGSDYFYTPGAVMMRFVHWAEAPAYPCYMVFSGSGGAIEATAQAVPYVEHTETFEVSIKGYVKDDTDTVSVMEKCLADIKKAIYADFRSGASGSLGNLAVNLEFDELPTTDDGYLSLEGFGFFDLRVKVSIIDYL